MEKVISANLYPRNYFSSATITRDTFGYPTLVRFYSASGQTGYTVFEHVKKYSTDGIVLYAKVLSKDILTPPVSPSTGDRYFIGGVGTGAWATHDYAIAEWNGTAWVFTDPVTGNAAFVSDMDQLYYYNGTTLEILIPGILIDWSIQNINESV